MAPIFDKPLSHAFSLNSPYTVIGVHPSGHCSACNFLMGAAWSLHIKPYLYMCREIFMCHHLLIKLHEVPPCGARLGLFMINPPSPSQNQVSLTQSFKTWSSPNLLRFFFFFFFKIGQKQIPPSKSTLTVI